MGSSLCFWRAHLGAAPQQRRELLWVVQGLMLEVTQAEAAERGIKYGFIPRFRPFYLSGPVCSSPWEIARNYMRSLSKINIMKVIEMLKQGMVEVLNEVLPEYRDQWRD